MQLNVESFKLRYGKGCLAYYYYFLAGFQSIQVEMIEAAEIDGANTRQMFRHIKLPFLLPSICIVLYCIYFDT